MKIFEQKTRGEITIGQYDEIVELLKTHAKNKEGRLASCLFVDFKKPFEKCGIVITPYFDNKKHITSVLVCNGRLGYNYSFKVGNSSSDILRNHAIIQDIVKVLGF